uniref:Uncharacterized protein n=1 Tax=Mycena chlorophos TaxID=658473 RepID=A0ABQ0LSQ1_MYCCL|nr:predicted protein [Mycena chlorophos]
MVEEPIQMAASSFADVSTRSTDFSYLNTLPQALAVEFDAAMDNYKKDPAIWNLELLRDGVCAPGLQALASRTSSDGRDRFRTGSTTRRGSKTLGRPSQAASSTSSSSSSTLPREGQPLDDGRGYLIKVAQFQIQHDCLLGNLFVETQTPWRPIFCMLEEYITESLTPQYIQSNEATFRGLVTRNLGTWRSKLRLLANDTQIFDPVPPNPGLTQLQFRQYYESHFMDVKRDFKFMFWHENVGHIPMQFGRYFKDVVIKLATSPCGAELDRDRFRPLPPLELIGNAAAIVAHMIDRRANSMYGINIQAGKALTFNATLYNSVVEGAASDLHRHQMNPVLQQELKEMSASILLDRGAFHQLVDVAKFVPRGADAYWQMKRVMEFGCMQACAKAGEDPLAAFTENQRAYHHAEVFRRMFSTSRLDLLPVVKHIYRDSPGSYPTLWKTLTEVRPFASPAAYATDALARSPPLSPSGLRQTLVRRAGAQVPFPTVCLPFPAENNTPFSPGAKAIEQKIAKGLYVPSPKRFPSFCYADGTWNENDYQQGLFRSVGIVRGLRLLLVSRSDAGKKAKEELPSGCLATIHSISKVSEHMVAYVVVQERLAISSAPEWAKQESKKYKFTTLFQKVLDAFQDDSNPDSPNWGQTTLDWLTQQVLGDASDEDSSDEADSEDEAVVQRNRRQAASARVLNDVSNVPPSWPVQVSPPNGLNLLFKLQPNPRIRPPHPFHVVTSQTIPYLNYTIVPPVTTTPFDDPDLTTSLLHNMYIP